MDEQTGRKGNGDTEGRKEEDSPGWRLGKGKWLYEHCCFTFPYVVTWFRGEDCTMALAKAGDPMKGIVEGALKDSAAEPGRVSIVCSRCGQSYFT